ncbi:MAG: WG repeat-containing protein [Alistipes sp.]|nr:WG repeat-containing protein [Alistipes sp.]
MNICTIVEFRGAVDEPCRRLRQLADACRADQSGLCRSTLFAECRMVWRGSQWLLHAPIALRSMEYAERAAMRLRSLVSDPLGSYRILRDEIVVDAATGAACDAVVEPLPAAQTLSQAVAGMDSRRLLDSVERLRRRLQRLDISHNNLSPDNIVVDAFGELHPIRLHYVTAGFGGDCETLTRLESYVAEHALDAGGCLHDTSAVYRAGRDAGAAEYSWAGNMFEDRVRVRTGSGYGFVDGDNREVVAPRYFWADDFREGRAAVQDFDSHMGLIDKNGREVIAPLYDIVEYDADTGISWVCLDSLWAKFDYAGKRTSEWLPREDCDIEL